MPFVLLIVLLIFILKKYRNLGVIAFCLVALTGFLVSVYPQSDLLHTYPFLGLVLVSLLLLPIKNKLNYIVLTLVILTIMTGFYLTFFTKSYHYEYPYFEYDAPLNLPRTQNILVTKSMAESTLSLAKFVNSRTSRSDYILAYPYSPLLYFILERQNPSKDLLYFLPDWHFYPDEIILSEMKAKKVKYVITNGDYNNSSLLSKFIRKQTEVFNSGQFRVFEIAAY